MSLDEKIEKCYGNITAIRVVHVKKSIEELKEKMPNVLTTTRGELITLHEIIKEVFGKGLI